MQHFKGKRAIHHVIEARARGIISTSESHGTEVPGHISAAADACKEMGIVLLLAYFLLPSPLALGIFALAYLIWKIGRSAHLGWARLERLHRVIEEEKWEIEHHRQQEREELGALYAAKGFEGQLLEDVLDVLMADGDRLLRVMLEEELGLSLQVYEHPLKQAVGAGIGALASACLCFIGLWLWPTFGPFLGALVAVAAGSIVAAVYEGNRVLSALVWNLGLTTLSCGIGYFVHQFVGGR